MLAALLLNLGAQTPTPAVGQMFGGGPFWRRYGYDSAYDEIRDQTTTGAIESIPAPDLVRVQPPINYRAINAIVSERVVSDMRILRDEVEKERQDFEELMIILLLGE